MNASPNITLGNSVNMKRVVNCAFAPLSIVTVQALCPFQASAQLDTTVLGLDLPIQIRMMTFLAYQHAVHQDCLGKGVGLDVHICPKPGRSGLRNHVTNVGATTVGWILIGKNSVQTFF